MDDPLLDDTGRHANSNQDSSLTAEEVFDDAAPSPISTHLASPSEEPRFDGDTSALPAEACWALQELIGSSYISSDSKHWPVVSHYEDTLRSRLSELGLLLEINFEHHFALTRQASSAGSQGRVLLRSKPLKLAASALALELYKQYISSVDTPIVEHTDLLDHLMVYMPPGDTDVAAFRARMANAIIQLERVHIIGAINTTRDRYTINPVITSIMTAEQVDALDQRYKAIARGESVDDTATAGDDDLDAEERDDPDE